MSLHAARLVLFVNSFHSLIADALKDLSPYYFVWLPGILNIEKDSDRSIFTGIYVTIRSLRYSGALPLKNVMLETGSSKVIWNIQEASTAARKLMLYVIFFECVRPDVYNHSALAVVGLSKIGEYYITLHCHSPVSQIIRVLRKVL